VTTRTADGDPSRRGGARGRLKIGRRRTVKNWNQEVQAAYGRLDAAGAGAISKSMVIGEALKLHAETDRQAVSAAVDRFFGFVRANEDPAALLEEMKQREIGG
jgi:hypothetical protein